MAVIMSNDYIFGCLQWYWSPITFVKVALSLVNNECCWILLTRVLFCISQGPIIFIIIATFQLPVYNKAPINDVIMNITKLASAERCDWNISTVWWNLPYNLFSRKENNSLTQCIHVQYTIVSALNWCWSAVSDHTRAWRWMPLEGVPTTQCKLMRLHPTWETLHVCCGRGGGQLRNCTQLIRAV